MDRYVTIGDYKYDRLLSKWAIYKEGASKDEIVSHARYANVDKIHVKQSVEAIPLKSKKGLGGLINHGFLASDLDALDIASATITSYLSFQCSFSTRRRYRILTVAGHIILMRDI